MPIIRIVNEKANYKEDRSDIWSHFRHTMLCTDLPIRHFLASLSLCHFYLPEPTLVYQWVNNIATIPQILGITVLLVHCKFMLLVLLEHTMSMHQQVAQTQSRCVRIVFEAAVVELCSCQLNCLIGPPPSPRPTSTAALIFYVDKYICVCVWLWWIRLCFISLKQCTQMWLAKIISSFLFICLNPMAINQPYDIPLQIR